MIINFEKRNIISELNYVYSIMEKSAKSSKSSTQNFILFSNCSSDRIQLLWTDSETFAITDFSAAFEADFSLALPIREFYQLIVRSDDGTIAIKQVSDTKFQIKAGAATFQISSVPGLEFPEVPNMERSIYSVDTQVFRRMLNLTQTTTSTQEQVRFTLSGVLFVINRNQLKMISTDGHRMSYAESNTNQEPSLGEVKIIIPKRTVVDMVKALVSVEGELLFSHDESRIYFQFDNKTHISRMMAGQFPNYEMVIPRNLENRIELNRQRLNDIVSRVEILSDIESKKISVFLSPNKMVFKSFCPTKGEAEEEVEIDYSGKEIEIKYNYQYLKDVFSLITAERINFDFSNEKSPTVISPKGEIDIVYKYILMPMST